jgi:hypothetical protein
MIELFGTLDYLESHGILHLDIKLDNLLVNETKLARLPSKLKIGKKLISLPVETYYIKIIDWGLSVNTKKKLFLENFTYKNDLPCLSPLYDFINFLNKINYICKPEARDFIRRLIRAIFHQDKSPKFKEGRDCYKTITSKHLQHFKFKDIFTTQDAHGPLF